MIEFTIKISEADDGQLNISRQTEPGNSTKREILFAENMRLALDQIIGEVQTRMRRADIAAKTIRIHKQGGVESILQQWQAYADAAIKPDMPHQIVKEHQRTFMSGAIAFFNLASSATNKYPQGHAEQVLDKIVKEALMAMDT